MLSIVLLGLLLSVLVVSGAVAITFYDVVSSRPAVAHDAHSAAACTSCRHQMIGVSLAEALAISALLRTQRPRELVRIHRRAQENARRSGTLTGQQYRLAQIVCPLLCDDGACAADGAKPRHCRQRQCGAESPCGDELRPTMGSIAAADRYELSSVLSVALTRPDATVRLAQGELVFAHCRQIDDRLH